MKECMKLNRPLQHFSLIYFIEQEFDFKCYNTAYQYSKGIKQFQEIGVQ